MSKFEMFFEKFIFIFLIIEFIVIIGLLILLIFASLGRFLI